MVQSQAVLALTTLEPCNLAAKKIILASQVLLFGGDSTASACYVLPRRLSKAFGLLHQHCEFGRLA